MSNSKVQVPVEKQAPKLQLTRLTPKKRQNTPGKMLRRTSADDLRIVPVKIIKKDSTEELRLVPVKVLRKAPAKVPERQLALVKTFTSRNARNESPKSQDVSAKKPRQISRKAPVKERQLALIENSIDVSPKKPRKITPGQRKVSVIRSRRQTIQDNIDTAEFMQLELRKQANNLASSNMLGEVLMAMFEFIHTEEDRLKRTNSEHFVKWVSIVHELITRIIDKRAEEYLVMHDMKLFATSYINNDIADLYLNADGLPRCLGIDVYDDSYFYQTFRDDFMRGDIDYYRIPEMGRQLSRVFAFISRGKGKSVEKIAKTYPLEFRDGYSSIVVRIRFNKDDPKEKPVVIRIDQLIQQYGFGFLEYGYADYDPGVVSNSTNRIFNLYNGPIAKRINWKSLTKDDKDDFQFFLDHIENQMCSKNPEWNNYFLCFMSWPIQHPGDKIGKVLVLPSVEGTGKSLVTNAYQKYVIGPLHGVTINGLDDILSPFNTLTYAKSVVIINEVVSVQGFVEKFSKFKSKITDVSQRSEAKFCTAEMINDMSAYWMLTNEAGAIYCPIGDRRYAFCIVSNEKMGDEYYEKLACITGQSKNLAKNKRSPYAFGNMLFTYLADREINLNMHSENSIPYSSIKQDVIDRSKGPERTFIQEVADGLFDPYKYAELLLQKCKDSSNLDSISLAEDIHFNRFERMVGKMTMFILFNKIWLTKRGGSYSGNDIKFAMNIADTMREIKAISIRKTEKGQKNSYWILPPIEAYEKSSSDLSAFIDSTKFSTEYTNCPDYKIKICEILTLNNAPDDIEQQISALLSKIPDNNLQIVVRADV